MFYFHPIRSKEPPILNFPTFDLAKYFYKMAATARSGCGEVGMKFSKQEFLKFFELVKKYLDAKTGSCEHQQIPSRTQKFSMLIGSKLSRVKKLESLFQGGGLGIFTDRDQRGIFGGFEFRKSVFLGYW